MVNSRYPLACAPPPHLRGMEALFFRSYEGNLPSSFNIILSSALVFSTSPPVSVWGTVLLLGLFPGSPRPPSQSSKGKRLSAFVTSSRLGNINPIPIDYGFRPRLRDPAHPARINLAQEPLDFRRQGLSPCLSLLMSAFSLPIPPAYLTVHLHRPTERSATTNEIRRNRSSAASVYGLSPDTFSAQDDLFRPVSYYAFFKGWLLLSQPPGCLGLPTSFHTEP